MPCERAVHDECANENASRILRVAAWPDALIRQPILGILCEHDYAAVSNESRAIWWSRYTRSNRALGTRALSVRMRFARNKECNICVHARAPASGMHSIYLRTAAVVVAFVSFFGRPPQSACASYLFYLPEKAVAMKNQDWILIMQSIMLVISVVDDVFSTFFLSLSSICYYFDELFFCEEIRAVWFPTRWLRSFILFLFSVAARLIITIIILITHRTMLRCKHEIV